MFGFSKKKSIRISLEDQLRALSEVGVHLKPDRTVDELLESFDREEYESEPYQTLVFVLGSEVETGIDAGAFYTDQLWVLDTECIESQGDYAKLIARLAELFGSELEITDITDSIDHDAQTASVHFSCNGKAYEQDLKYNDDWLDDKLFLPIVRASIEARTKRKLGFTFPDGQCINLCLLTPSQMKAFTKLTGVPMSVLWPKNIQS